MYNGPKQPNKIDQFRLNFPFRCEQSTKNAHTAFILAFNWIRIVNEIVKNTGHTIQFINLWIVLWNNKSGRHSILLARWSQVCGLEHFSFITRRATRKHFRNAKKKRRENEWYIIRLKHIKCYKNIFTCSMKNVIDTVCLS